MSEFPRTTVGGVCVSRMIVGTNWFLGWSHCTPAKDKLVHETVGDYKKMADVLEVFFEAGVDTVMGFIQLEKMVVALANGTARHMRKAVRLTRAPAWRLMDAVPFPSRRPMPGQPLPTRWPIPRA